MAPLVIPVAGVTSSSSTDKSILVDLTPSDILGCTPSVSTFTIQNRLQTLENLLEKFEPAPLALKSAITRLVTRSQHFIMIDSIQQRQRQEQQIQQVNIPNCDQSQTKQEFETLLTSFDTITVTILETMTPLNRSTTTNLNT
ncbi:hypothetical protein OIO90_005200 [Microbotryomycetes sp. JL221]|nr:hypothetical protein OIO90_005200 [Microbotryomycetes sp. JL221]